MIQNVVLNRSIYKCVSSSSALIQLQSHCFSSSISLWSLMCGILTNRAPFVWSFSNNFVFLCVVFFVVSVYFLHKRSFDFHFISSKKHFIAHLPYMREMERLCDTIVRQIQWYRESERERKKRNMYHIPFCDERDAECCEISIQFWYSRQTDSVGIQKCII